MRSERPYHAAKAMISRGEGSEYPGFTTRIEFSQSLAGSSPIAQPRG